MRAARLAAALAWLGVAAFAGAHAQPATPAFRFATVEVFISAGAPLAAWQFELAEREGRMTVVGVENGDSAAFGEAPYYDLAAVRAGSAERIIVADYSLSGDAGLPLGRTRVATVHVRLSGAEEPAYELRLIAAGDSAGRPIEAAISFSEQ